MGRYVFTKRSSPSSSAPALILLSLVCLLSCSEGGGAEREEEIVIGVIAPLTGDLFFSGAPTVEGAALAADEIRRAGGLAVGSRRRAIRLVIEDDAGRPETGVSKAVKLITVDRAAALIGPTVSDIAIAVARVAEENRVPMIATLSTSPETTRGKEYAFRATFSDDFQGRLMARFAAEELGARRAAVLVDAGSTYSRGFAQVFADAFSEEGGTEVAVESFTADESAAVDQLARIREAEPDVLVLPVYDIYVPPLMRQARRAGITATFLGGDSWDLIDFDEHPERGASFFSAVWSSELADERTKRFVDSFETSYGKVPRSAAAIAYDALAMICRAIENRGDAAPESIRMGLRSLGEFRGVTGTIRYGVTGDPRRSAVILEMDGSGRAWVKKRIEPRDAGAAFP